MFAPRRKILLSIRERPLPVLWLLTWLAPYLLFNIAAIPHFHNGEFPEGQSFRGTSVSLHITPHQHADAPHAQHQTGDCFLCEWTSGAHSSLSAPQDVALETHVCAGTAVSFSSHTTPYTAVYDGRGPPLSL